MNYLYKRLAGAVLSGTLMCSMTVPALAVDDVLDTPSEPSGLVSQSLLLDIDKAGDTLIAVGERGHVAVSKDNGKTWIQSNVPVSVMLTAVDFADDKTGWAVGHGAVILKSTDGGVSWAKQFDGNQANQMIIEQAQALVTEFEAAVEEASEDELDDLEYELEEAQFGLEDAQFDAEVGASKPLLDVLFLSDKEGFALGSYGFLFKTEDGGKSWVNYGDRMDNPDRFHLNSMTRIAGGALLVAGEAGVMFRSDDNGESWEYVDSPYEGSFFGVLATKEEGVVLAFGLRGNLFRSQDAGVTWEAVDSNTETTLMSGSVGPTGVITIVGNSGVVVFSEDGGNTFKTYTRPDRLSNAASVYIKRKRMVVVGEGGISLTDSMGQNL